MKRILCSLALSACLACPALAGAQASASRTADISVTVTAIDHRPKTTTPQLPKDDVVVHQKGKVRPVVAWEPLNGSPTGMDVAILVDDSLEHSVAIQWKTVGGFIRMLPKDSRVAVVYGRLSGATFVQPFTTDHEKAAKALRIPMGTINEGSSIYLSLVELIHKWPADGHRRVVLLISDGIDLFYGVLDSEPGVNQNLEQAVNQSQKNGVVVDAIFASGASHFSRNLFLINNGQSCLARLSLETGGTAYTNGLQTPVSFTPYLRKIAESFANMYVLTFQAALPSKAGFARINLTAEPQGVELLGPSRVYLPAAH